MGFQFGIMNGWPSPAIFLLTSAKSPLATGEITITQASWIASLKPVGMVLGSIFISMIANKFGRKRPLLAVTVPAIVRQSE